jgi:hypothetical protein
MKKLRATYENEKVSKDLEFWAKKIGKILNVVLVFSVIACVWIVSIYVARKGFANLPPLRGVWDLTAILFGAAQVSLFIFSILLGVLTFFGWQAVERKISDAVEKATKEQLATVDNEARGRSFAIMGYIIGENSVNEDFTAPTSEERLREAISYCNQAYNFLKGSGLSAEFLALNNLLGYSCALGDTERRGYLLECARRLRKAAEEHGSQNLLLTYCRTILKFSLEPDEIKEACFMVEDIKSSSKLNKKQKREADYLASLCVGRILGRSQS